MTIALTDPDAAAPGREAPASCPAAPRTRLARSLVALIEGADFPCVGAKAALAQEGLSIIEAGRITDPAHDPRLHRALVRWSALPGGEAGAFRSLAVVFAGPRGLGERGFERALWDRLGRLAALDRAAGHAHDPQVSSDPEDPRFALSFGGRAYFAVGLHPQASRRARRLPFPAIIFNRHDQFERLREQRQYERMREVILARDVLFDGTPNPMVARHGTVSEARQYSGRAVGADWVCPLARREDEA